MFFEGIIEFPDRPKLLSPEVMAYIGDGVYEMFIRSLVLERKLGKGHALHDQTVKYVNASAQFELLERIKDELTTEEQSIVRRGRNCKTNIPSNADPQEYCYSTGFEALLGFLYLKKEKERLSELCVLMKRVLEQEDFS
ncbi:MAG: Mini-ribonuclease 3 [Bacillota bacterium]